MFENTLRSIAAEYGLLFYKHSKAFGSNKVINDYNSYIDRYPYKIYRMSRGIEIGKEGLFSVVIYEVLLGDISLEELNFRSEEEMLDFIKKWCFSLNS